MTEPNRRIAFLMHDLRDGGAERVTVSLANGIAALDIAVDLVLVNQTGENAYFESLNERVRLVDLNAGRTLASVLGFKHYFHETRPDVIISALTHVNVAAILAHMTARYRPRLIVVEHNQMSQNRQRKTGFVKLAYSFVPWLYRRADVIGAVSEGVKTDLVKCARLTDDHVTVLYNPVVTPSLRRLSDVEPGHRWFKPGEPPVILAVGRLTPQKNFQMLIEAFTLLRVKREARLMILGEGELRAQLEAQASATGFGVDIELAGFVDNPFAFMKRAGVFALSSDWEGLPTVLIEAMACGVPVVATDCKSGPSEILLDGSLAPLTPPGDAKGFAQALGLALDQKRPAAALMARADAFNTEAAVQHYLKVAFPSGTAKKPLAA